MFAFFNRDPSEKLNARYLALLEEAKNAQRSGDIRLYSELSESADLVLKELNKLQADGNKK